MTFCARFVIPKTCDWTTAFDGKTIVVASKDEVGPRWGVARIVVSDLPGPWIAQRAVSVKATPTSFKGDMEAVLRAFSRVDDDESTDVRLLVANAEFDSMTTNSRQTLVDLQQTANVVVGGYEVYPLIGETAIHVVGRLPAVVKFARLLNDSSCDKTVVLANGRLAVDRQPMEQIGTATTSDSAATWPFRVSVRHVQRCTSSPRLIATVRPNVEITSGLVTEPAIRHVTARSRNQAMYRATLAYAAENSRRNVANIPCDDGPRG